MTMQKQPAWIFQLFLYIVFLCQITMAPAAERKQEATHYPMRVIKSQQVGYFVFCGDENVLASFGSITGLRIINTSTGAVKQITYKKTHKGLVCTNDGQAAFYVDNLLPRRLNMVSIATGENIEVYYSSVKGESLPASADMLSANDRYLIVPDKTNPNLALLPNIQPIHVPRQTPDYQINGMAWCGDNYFYLLEEKGENSFLARLNPDSSRLDEYSLKQPGKPYFTKAQCQIRARSLYILGWFDIKGKGGRLYSLDIHSRSMQPVVDELDDFSSLPSGDVVYIIQKDTELNDSSGALKNSESAYNAVVLRKAGGQEFLLYSAPLSTRITNLQSSRTGRQVAFLEEPNSTEGKAINIVIIDLSRK